MNGTRLGGERRWPRDSYAAALRSRPSGWSHAAACCARWSSRHASPTPRA